MSLAVKPVQLTINGGCELLPAGPPVVPDDPPTDHVCVRGQNALPGIDDDVDHEAIRSRYAQYQRDPAT